MDWKNIFVLFKLENVIYWIVSMVVVIITTIKQFNKQEKKNKNSNTEILNNLQTIEKQNIKMINLLDVHSQDIKSIKKDIKILENRVNRLEDSHVNIYRKTGGKDDTY